MCGGVIHSTLMCCIPSSRTDDLILLNHVLHWLWFLLDFGAAALVPRLATLYTPLHAAIGALCCFITMLVRYENAVLAAGAPEKRVHAARILL